MMTRAEPIANWMEKPMVHTESWALFWAILAVLVPTIFREIVSGSIMGCGTIPYVPSVLLSAVFLGWRFAAIVALLSALVADWLFLGSPYSMTETCDFFGVGLFLFASALIIASVELPRRLPRETASAVPDKNPAGIVFSLEKGQAWASWYGQKHPVRLGPEGEVAEMMEDFLAQLELGKRLTNNPS